MNKYLNHLVIAVCFLLVAACSTTSNNYSTDNAAESLTIYLVRHAEKTTERPDPGLTEEGEQRALELVNVLQDKKLTDVHSSDYIRTRETARPSADFFDLEIQLYDAGDLPAMANKLLQLSGNHLVVGHSNTTPQLVELLGGDSVSEIDEASEYDRLYVITIAQDKSVKSQLMRFGVAYVE